MPLDENFFIITKQLSIGPLATEVSSQLNWLVLIYLWRVDILSLTTCLSGNIVDNNNKMNLTYPEN